MKTRNLKITTKIVRPKDKFRDWKDELRYKLFSSMGRTVYGVVDPWDHRTILHVCLTRREARRSVLLPRSVYRRAQGGYGSCKPSASFR